MQLWAVARRGRQKQQGSQLKLRRKPGLQGGVGRCYKGPCLPSSDRSSQSPSLRMFSFQGIKADFGATQLD